MIRAALWILLSAARAVEPGPFEGPVLGEGPQGITVRVAGPQAGSRVEAEVPDRGTLALADPGTGVWTGTFRGDPARAVHLRLVDVSAAGRTDVWDGLIVLADREREVLSFRYEPGAGRPRVARVAATPSAREDLALDARAAYTVAWGWGAFCLAWVGLLVGLWRRGGRRGA